MAQEIPEREFYACLYVEPGPSREDGKRFRSRVAAYLLHQLKDYAWTVGPAVEVETGYLFQGRTYYPQPLVLPDDLAILAVSQGAGFIRWLMDIDRRQRG